MTLPAMRPFVPWVWLVCFKGSRMQSNDSTIRWRRRALLALALLTPLLTLVISGLLLGAIPVQGMANDPPNPPPLLPVAGASGAPPHAEHHAKPIRAFVTIGLMADKPEGLDPLAYCPPHHEVEAAPGEIVALCYQMFNDSEITFTHHTVVDNIFGIILENELYTVTPTFAVQTVATIPASATRTNVMTWTAYAENDDSVSAFDSVKLIVPTLITTLTVGQTPGSCGETAALNQPAPGAVELCFRAYNPNPYALIGHHAVTSDDAPLPLPDDLVLAPQEVYTLTTAEIVTEPTTFNLVWTARTATRSIPVTATAAAAVRVPHLDASLSFGRRSNPCQSQTLTVTPGTPVVYCYTVLNDGGATFTHHQLSDAAFALEHAFAYSLTPDLAVGLVYTRALTTTTTSQVTWSASLTDGRVLSDTTQGVVFVVPPSLIEVAVLLDGATTGAGGVLNVDIRLSAPDSIAQTRTTDSSGIARFDDLIPGVYTLEVMTHSLPSSVQLLSPTIFTTSLTAKTTANVTYIVTGTLPIQPLHLPLIAR